MGGCGSNQKKFNCGGTKQNASCVFYEIDLPEFSELEDCVTIEETTEELYNTTKNILDSMNMEQLDESCITYPKTTVDGKQVVTLISVLNEHQKRLCAEDTNNSTTTVDLTQIDLKCLATECDSEVKSLNQVIQLLIDKYCELYVQIN